MPTYTQVVAYYERWSGRVAALLGRNAPHDQDTAQKTPDSAWRPTRQWARWQPQPWHGWHRGPDPGVVPPDVPDAPPSPTVRPWARWRSQPWRGWFAAGDQTQAPPPLAPTPVIWGRGFRLQPNLGWSQANDQDQTATPVWPPLVAWTAAWKRQPWLGWSAAGDQAAPQVEEIPPATILRPYLFTAYPRQPWLGWAAALDEGVPPLVDAPLAQPPHPYLFKGYRLQPTLGWAAAGDVPSITGVTRDCGASGTPLGGVTVLAFRTSDNVFVGSTVSDANGVYTLALPVGPTYYLVAYLVNAPDVFGTTRNDLVPT